MERKRYWINKETLQYIEELVNERRTASTIAFELSKKLGFTVTRSAVLGAMHRAQIKSQNPRGGQPGFSTIRASAMIRSRTLKLTDDEQDAAPPKQYPNHFRRSSKTAPQAFVGAPSTLMPTTTLLDLREGQCKWPIGNPGSEGFGFCGRVAASGSCYCSAHFSLSLHRNAPSAAAFAASEVVAAL